MNQPLPQPLSSNGDDKKGNAPVFNAPAVVLAVIGLLVLIHLLRSFGGEEMQVWSVYAFSFIPERFVDGAVAQIPGSKWWSFLTSGLMHFDWMHLGFNSIWLLVFGTPVARALGAGRFLILAAVATIAGACGTLGVHWGERIYMMGASSAVSGLTAAALPIMFGRGTLQRGTELSQSLSLPEYIWNPRAMGFTFLWLALQILPEYFFGASSVVISTAFLEERNIAWEAHVGGFIGGLVVFYLMRGMSVAKSAGLR